MKSENSLPHELIAARMLEAVEEHIGEVQEAQEAGISPHEFLMRSISRIHPKKAQSAAGQEFIRRVKAGEFDYVAASILGYNG